MKDFLDRGRVKIRACQDIDDVLSFESFAQLDSRGRRRGARAFNQIMGCPPKQPDRADDLAVAAQNDLVNPVTDDVEGQRGGNPGGDAIGESVRVFGLDDAAFFPGEIDARRAFGLHAVDLGFGRERAKGRDHAANAAAESDGRENRVGLFAPLPQRFDDFNRVGPDAVDQMRLVGRMYVAQIFGFRQTFDLLARFVEVAAVFDQPRAVSPYRLVLFGVVAERYDDRCGNRIDARGQRHRLSVVAPRGRDHAVTGALTR